MNLVINPSLPSVPLTHEGAGGWTALRLAVIGEAAGVCARCGTAGADTATHGWDARDGADELVAAHTRCVVGLGPPATASRGAAHLRAA